MSKLPDEIKLRRSHMRGFVVQAIAIMTATPALVTSLLRGYLQSPPAVALAIGFLFAMIAAYPTLAALRHVFGMKPIFLRFVITAVASQTAGAILATFVYRALFW